VTSFLLSITTTVLVWATGRSSTRSSSNLCSAPVVVAPVAAVVASQKWGPSFQRRAPYLSVSAQLPLSHQQHPVVRWRRGISQKYTCRDPLGRNRRAQCASAICSSASDACLALAFLRPLSVSRGLLPYLARRSLLLMDGSISRSLLGRAQIKQRGTIKTKAGRVARDPR
jgi:hypothetical protein